MIIKSELFDYIQYQNSNSRASLLAKSHAWSYRSIGVYNP